MTDVLERPVLVTEDWLPQFTSCSKVRCGARHPIKEFYLVPANGTANVTVLPWCQSDETKASPTSHDNEVKNFRRFTVCDYCEHASITTIKVERGTAMAYFHDCQHDKFYASPIDLFGPEAALH